MATMASPYKAASDSPSRQLLYELSRLGVTSQEDLYARLDQDNLEREILHKEALTLAAAEHDRVRESAVAVQKQLQLQIEAERKRRDEEEHRTLERLRQEKADREIAEKRRAIDQAKNEEANRKRLAEVREAAAAAQQRKAREEEEAETARRLKEAEVAESKKRQEDEAKRKVAEAESSAREAAVAAQKPVVAPQPTPGSTLQANLDPGKVAEHQRYVEIHRKLKELRKGMLDQAKQNRALKDTMGDIRRGIRQSVGQLTAGKGVNKIPLQKIIGGLKSAMSYGGPKIDITTYLASPPLNTSDTGVPALFLYEMNILAKAVIAQFIDEAGVSPKTADPVGIITSHIFTMPAFRWNDISLIDILIAKLHVVCPVLFGIYGDDTANPGKARIGWWREAGGGPWVSEQRHRERMTGLGAGFAALSARNYSKTELRNPFPNYKYWQSFSCILNTPAQDITQTHFVVLKAMIEFNETRMLELFGSAAIVLLRQALLEFPKRNPALERSVGAVSLGGLADVLKKDKKIYL